MLFCLLSVGFMTSALAHNVVSGVYADGLLIEGEIGFSNGDMAPAGLVVEVFDESGSALGKTQTKAEGIFLFEASSAQKHVFKVDLGAGHIAEMVLDANELSADAANVTAVESISTSLPTATQSNTVSNDTIGSISTEQFQRLIRNAVAQQVRPLQKEIRAYKEKVFFRDITGGLGFIFGLFGVAAWMASRRKETNP
ncbi:cobalt ABC transporter permease [Leucothrix arctica]|uniref:Cobalt ABC transporter permease n=2 Tax=Leucothrix arctica TaxID=1481894 RepID=A0A317CGZ9_9GAMM|nr:cobalt ABC transporter permease [Leucothrix arctica]